MRNPFRYFNSSPEIIQLTVMMYVHYPLSLRQLEDMLHERGIDICHETVWYWWNRFGPIFVSEIRKRGIQRRRFSLWRWPLDEVFVKINGKPHNLWRAVVHKREVLQVFATKRRNRKAALSFLKRAMKRYGQPRSIVTDRLPSYWAAMKVIDKAVIGGVWQKAQQPSREFSLNISATRESNGEIQGLQNSSEIQLSPRFNPQSL